jgi:transposase
LENAYGVTTEAAISNIAQLNVSLAKLEASLSEHFKQHPSAKVILSLPGMGTVLGARVLGEFGDDPNRYCDAKSRKNYAGTSPVTKASGKSKVVLARHSRNRRLASALDQWAFSSLLPSPGARHYYDDLKARDKHHRKAIRQLANKWVGILHGCLESDCPYDENIAWNTREERAA